MTFENFSATHWSMARFIVIIVMWIWWINLWNWAKFLLWANTRLCKTWLRTSHLLTNWWLFSWTLSTGCKFRTLCLSWTVINLTIVNSSTSNHVLLIISFDLSQVCLKTLNLSNESIFFKSHQHLFLNSCLILSRVWIKLWLEGFIFSFTFIDITIQLLFFLLNTSVIDLLEISLFSKFVISWSGFFSDDSCFVNFFLESCQDVR
jgi:hypothetical protein